MQYTYSIITKSDSLQNKHLIFMRWKVIYCEYFPPYILIHSHFISLLSSSKPDQPRFKTLSLTTPYPISQLYRFSKTNELKMSPIQTPIRVGIIGLGIGDADFAAGLWAVKAHLPYLLASPHYTIAASTQTPSAFPFLIRIFLELQYPL
jgi:hypothetical protein